MPKFNFELTDTINGGEANYAWVKRTTVELPDSVSDKYLGMLAREWAGFTALGVRCTMEGGGFNDMTFRPRGMCQVLFVTHDASPVGISVEQVVEWAHEVRKADTTEYVSMVRARERNVAAAIVTAVAMIDDAGDGYAGIVPWAYQA